MHLRLGFLTETVGYSIDVGLPAPERPAPPEPTAFAHDPEIKLECVWGSPTLRPASLLAERRGPVLDAPPWRWPER
jgi:predicted ATPase